ncbi:MAG: M28 family peptidase [Bacteroidales bacterium]
MPTCYIEGSDPSAGEVILSAHLFEGYVKQGANDNISGSAAIMEVARALQTLVDQGRIPRPARSIRFIWVPEYSGTIPWVADHREIISGTLCNINLDMVGLNLSENGSFLTLQRTTYGNPHYVNDVMENYFEYVGITNREGLAVSGRGGFTKRIVAPSGSDDPFYFQVDDHYGSSDHEVFNDPSVGVPGIMMITWPDLYYHTSQDRADKCDPTEMKRASIIAAAGAYTIASADKYMGMTIASEVVSNGSSRIGNQLARATNLVEGSDKGNFDQNYNLGRDYIMAATLNEKSTLRSITELDRSLGDFIDAEISLIDNIGSAALASLDLYMKSTAHRLGVKPAAARSGDLVKKAGTVYPVKTTVVEEEGYGINRTVSESIREYRDKYPVKGRADVAEIIRLCNGSNNVNQIKALIDTQRMAGESDLESVYNIVMILSKTGLVELKK